MKRWTKFLAALTAALLICGMFAACGKGSEVAEIKKSGKLVVLTSADFPPLEYQSEGGGVAGVDMDICQAIADELGVKLEIVDMDFAEIPAAIAAGKGDIAAAGMTVTEERRQSMDFTESYLPASQYLLVPVGSSIKTAADLEGKVIGVQMGTTGDCLVAEQGNAKSIERYATLTEAAAALMSGKLDAVVIDELPARAIAAQNADKLEVAGEKLTEEEYALGIAKDSDLLKKANKVIAELKEEGKIDAFVSNHSMK